MKFKLSAMLAKQLVRVSSIIAAKSANALLENIHILTDSDGLTFRASNGSQHFTIACAFNEVEVHDEGEIMVDNKRLVSVINALNDAQDATFTASGEGDKLKLVVQSGRSRSQIQCAAGNTYPCVNVVFEPNSVEMVVPFAELHNMYVDVMSFAAINDVRTALNHFHLDTNLASNQLRLCATNGHCVGMSYTALNQPQLSNDVSLVVPRSCFSALSGKCFDANDKVSLKFDGRWFQLRCGNTTFSSVSVDQSFPDVNRVIPQQNNKEIRVDVLAFREAVQRVSIINNKVNPSVTCLFSHNELKIISANRTTDEDCEDCVSCELSCCDGDCDGEFSVMPQYLINALNAAHGDSVLIKCSQPNVPILILSEHSQNQSVIAPCRV